MLSGYLHKATPSHVTATKYKIKYLKGSVNFGIMFSSENQANLKTFVKFSTKFNTLLSFSDANWEPQDASVPKVSTRSRLIPLFKSRSIFRYLIWLGGTIYWQSKRQTITAHSTTEAGVYATNECTKKLLYIRHILLDLNLLHDIVKAPIKIYNDNEAAVKWSQNLTNKGLRHIQMRKMQYGKIINVRLLKFYI